MLDAVFGFVDRHLSPSPSCLYLSFLLFYPALLLTLFVLSIVRICPFVLKLLRLSITHLALFEMLSLISILLKLVLALVYAAINDLDCV